MKKKIIALVLLFLTSMVFAQANRCLDFTSSDDDCAYINHDLGIGLTYTAECWINPDILTGSGDHSLYGYTIMASSYSAPLGYPLWITQYDGEIRVWTYESTPTAYHSTTGLGLQADNWYHIAVSATSNGTTTIYVDGDIELTYTNDGDNSWTQVFTIGDLRPNRGIGFDGKICGVRIWDNVRTQTQIQDNMNQVVTTGTNLVGAWFYDSNELQSYSDVANDYDGTLGLSNSIEAIDPVWDTDCPLPVTLSIFNVAYHNAASVLTWTTQSETDNYGWNIYRSETDNFANSQIQNSEIIEGAGTTSIPTYYSFVDPYELVPEKEYWYWLENISYSGDSDFHGPLTLMTPTDQDEEDTPEVPETYGLTQNYPNPFNPSTKINFALPTSGSGELVIYDTKGRKVKTVFTGTFLADHNYNYVWNGDDEAGKKVSSGIYFYRLTASSVDQTKKMILMK